MAKDDIGIRPILKDGKQVRDAQGRLVWEVRVAGGWDPMKKRYRTYTERVHGTKTHARKKRDELRRQVEGGIDPKAGEMSFHDFSEKWLDMREKEGDLEDATLRQYRQQLKAMDGYIGAMPMKNVSTLVIDEMLCSLRENGLSNNTVRKYRTLLKRVFAQAVDYDMVMRNPVDKIRVPRRDPHSRESLSAEQAAKLLRSIDEATEKAYEAELAKESRRRDDGGFERGYIRGLVEISELIAARIGLMTGMRAGEVLALRWGDLDLGSGTIQVRRSLTYNMKTKSPKTQAGIRSIRIDKGTIDALEKWRGVQAGELAKIGVEAGTETPVSCDSKGGYIGTSNFGHWWRSFADSNGFEGVVFHQLRHSQASLLIAQGVDVKTVQERLGHADAGLTLNWYVHRDADNDAAAADMFGRLLEGKPRGRIVKLAKAAGF